MVPFKEIPRYPADFDKNGAPIPAESKPKGMPTAATSIFNDELSMDVAHLLSGYIGAKSSSEQQAALNAINTFSDSPQRMRSIYIAAQERLSNVPSPADERRKMYARFFAKFSPAADLAITSTEFIPENFRLCGCPSETAMKHLGLRVKEDLVGKKVLDIGAGYSDLTADLMSRGVDAYAVDPFYINQPNLLAIANKHNLSRDYKAVLKRFQRSIGEYPDHYKAGSALSLPFDSATADIIVSHLSMLSYLDNDYSLLQGAIDEALRVLKSGGVIKLFPYNSRYPGMPHDQETKRLDNNVSLFNELQQRDDVTVTAEAFQLQRPAQRLVIRKK